MTVYVHFRDGAPAVKQHNVATIQDQGDSTVVLVNAFGGDPKVFSNVKNVACEPERD